MRIRFSLLQYVLLFVSNPLALDCWGDEVQHDYFGARFKEGQGIELSVETKRIIGLQTVEVEEIEQGSKNIAIIPVSSILKTVTGTYVYVVNGKYYLRTQVTLSEFDSTMAHVSDGLFPGDEVVTTPVNSLWYAELQAIRGGKACTDGH